MSILSPQSGINNWLKKNGYLNNKQSGTIIKQYQETTGIKLNLEPLYINHAYGKKSNIFKLQQKQFKEFTNWCKLNLTK